MTSADIAIVGLGPVGATLANLLGRLGLRVDVFERDRTAYALPRAVHFDDEVMRVFQSI
ncbi:MAG: FAD-dependent monooxygenase, partial [Alphaproteobacteria bacterium]|nr:FAD-dependent monooxygenase [Alphaproteobacteria bacterium]